MKVYDDARVAAYLGGVVARLERAGTGDATRPAVAVVVLEDPSLNAFALPGGRLFVHTGLLAAVESEGQLAMLLARELARREDLEAWPWPPPARVEPLPRTTLGPTAAAILGGDLRLMSWAAIGAAGPESERGVDRAGVARLVAAGYDAGQAASVFERLARHDPGRGSLELFRHGDATRMRERARALRDLVGGDDAGSSPAPRAGRDATFEAALRPVVRDNAALDARAGRFELARRALDRVLADTPDDPIARLHDGDLHRLRAQRAADAAARELDTAGARAAYARATELDPGYAPPFRQLGLLCFETRDAAGARRAFERYLELAPGAPDAVRIREYLAVLHD